MRSHDRDPRLTGTRGLYSDDLRDRRDRTIHGGKSGGALTDLSGRRVAVIENTTSAAALQTHLSDNLIDAEVVLVADREEGMTQLEDGDVDGFPSDQIVLLGEAMEAVASGSNLSYSFADELFSFEPYAMMVQRNDADFRLVTNREIAQLYQK